MLWDEFAAYLDLCLYLGVVLEGKAPVLRRHRVAVLIVEEEVGLIDPLRMIVEVRASFRG